AQLSRQLIPPTLTYRISKAELFDHCDTTWDARQHCGKHQPPARAHVEAQHEVRMLAAQPACRTPECRGRVDMAYAQMAERVLRLRSRLGGAHNVEALSGKLLDQVRTREDHGGGVRARDDDLAPAKRLADLLNELKGRRDRDG